MTRKPRAPATWRAAFLRALAGGRSIAHAAREAGIDPSSAHRVRQRDAAFARAWATAREKGVVRLTESEPGLAPDEVVRGSKDGRMRVQRAGPGRFGAGKEQVFLEVLAATGNISAACRVAGVSNVALYRRKERWPGFAARWEAALAQGWRALDALLLERASVALGGAAATGGAADGEGQGAPPLVPPMTVEQAIAVWKANRHAATGEGRRPRHDWARRCSMDDVRAEVLKRLKAMGK